MRAPAKHLERWAILNVQMASVPSDPLGRSRGREPDEKAKAVNRKFERPVTAQAAVLTELRQRIIRGELTPGQAIRQEILASELGVSRLPVREALVVLQSERLVEYTQHKGYIVAVLDEQDLRQTYELRDTLESIAIAQAVPQLTDETIQAMREVLVRISQAESPSRIERIERNREFYFHLFEASGNARLISLLSQLWDTCDRYRALYWSPTPDIARVKQLHDAVIRAVESRDVDRVREILAERRESSLGEALRVVREQRENSAARLAPTPN